MYKFTLSLRKTSYCEYGGRGLS